MDSDTDNDSRKKTWFVRVWLLQAHGAPSRLRGAPWHGVALPWRGAARHGVALPWRGAPWRGVALPWRGAPWYGVARHGTAWRCHAVALP